MHAPPPPTPSLTLLPTYSHRAMKPRGRGVGRGINYAHDPTTPIYRAHSPRLDWSWESQPPPSAQQIRPGAEAR